MIETNWTESDGDLHLSEVAITEHGNGTFVCYEVCCDSCGDLSTGLTFMEARNEFENHEHRVLRP